MNFNYYDNNPIALIEIDHCVTSFEQKLLKYKIIFLNVIYNFGVLI